MQLKGLKIAFLGDSIAEGTGASTPDKCFVSLFAAAHPEATVNNYSIGGTKIAAQQVIRQDWDKNPFFTRVEKIDTDTDLIFVMGGTNDFGHGDVPMGKQGFVINNYSFYGAYIALIVSLKARCPDALIVIATPIHRHGEDFIATRPDGKWTLKDYVATIKDVAKYCALPVLDLWATSGIQPNFHADYVKYTVDGLHPNDLGHQRIFETLDKFIQNY